MKTVIIIYSFVFLTLSSCGRQDQVNWDAYSQNMRMRTMQLDNLGRLIVDPCLGVGASMIELEGKSYPVSSESSLEFKKMLEHLTMDEYEQVRPISVDGCKRVYKIEFNGEQKLGALNSGGSGTSSLMVVTTFRLL